MRRAWTILMIVALLLAPAGVVLAQGPPDDPGPPGDENESGEENESDEEEADDRRDRGAEYRERNRRSHFQADNGSYVGTYVAFQLDENASEIQDYRLIRGEENISVFDAITLPASNDSDVNNRGAQFQYETDDGRVHIIDVPPAILTIEGDDDANASTTVTLADGVTATLVAEDTDDEEAEDENETEDAEEDSATNASEESDANESDADEADDEDEAEDENETEEADDEPRTLYRLSLANNRSAYFAGENLTYDNGTFTVDDTAHFRLATPFRGMDRGADDDEGDEERRGPPEDLDRGAHALDHRAHDKLEQAKVRGNVSVEVHVDGNQSTPAELGHVQVRDAWTRSEENPNVRAGLRIAADADAPGTTVTIDLNASALGNMTVAEAAQQLSVTFDNETIEPADDLDDVLNWRNDDGQAEYLLLVGGENVQALVSVPNFSVHTVEVQEQSDASADSTNGAPGVGVIGALLATGLGAALLATRKKE